MGFLNPTKKGHCCWTIPQATTSIATPSLFKLGGWASDPLPFGISISLSLGLCESHSFFIFHSHVASLDLFIFFFSHCIIFSDKLEGIKGGLMSYFWLWLRHCPTTFILIFIFLMIHPSAASANNKLNERWTYCICIYILYMYIYIYLYTDIC